MRCSEPKVGPIVVPPYLPFFSYFLQWMGMDGDGWGWMGMDGDGWGWMGMDGDGWGWMGMDGDGWGWMGIVTQISVNEQLYFVHICSDTGMC